MPKQAPAAAGEAAVAPAAVDKPQASAKEVQTAKSEVNIAGGAVTKPEEVKTTEAEKEMEMVRRIPRLTPAQVRAQQQAFHERQMREIWEWVEDVVDADTDITTSNVQVCQASNRSFKQVVLKTFLQCVHGTAVTLGHPFSPLYDESLKI